MTPEYYMIGDTKAIITIGQWPITAHRSGKISEITGERTWRCRLTREILEATGKNSEVERTAETLEELCFKLGRLIAPYAGVLEEDSNILFNDVAKEWLSFDHDWEDLTLKRKESIVSFMMVLNRGLKLTDIDHRYILNQIRELREVETVTVSDCKVSELITAYRGIFEYAVNNHYKRTNPMTGIRKPKIQKHLRWAISEEEQKILKDSYPEDSEDGFFVHASLILGTRPSELCGLTWDDIDEESGCVKITRVLTQSGKKGESQKLILRPHTKNLVDRILVISDTEMDLFRRQKERQALLKERFPHRWNSEFPNMVCTTGYGDPMNLTALQKRFRMHCDKLGGRFHEVTLYHLRHTAASNLYHITKDILKVQEFLGHTSIINTGLYVHSLLEDQKEVAEMRSKTFGV